MLPVVFGVGAPALGACVGSFLNVVIYRLPQEEPAQRSLGGRSRCPHCGTQIVWRDNLPIVGWLLRAGKARCCGGTISVRYPLVEALTALLFLLLWLWPPHGDVVVGSSIRGIALTAWLFDAAFLSFLVANTFIDWDHRILPDALTKPFMVVGVVAATLMPGYAGWLFAASEVGGGPGQLAPAVAGGLASVLGLAVGFGLTWLIRYGAERVFRKPAMGFGDVKFMAAIGAFLGWKATLLTFFLGCIVCAVGGLIHRAATGDSYIPFGPFLAVGAGLSLFLGADIAVFLTKTWPEWQASSPWASAVMSGLALVGIVALLVLARRGRANG